jgi:hypothetical protein
MNLIVSRASKDYVLQVTGGRLPQNVLYCARNGIAAMGYAGADEIAGVPTGQWLAEALPWRRDLGHALTTLAQALSDAPVPVESSFDLHVVGWQWSGKRCRPVVAGVSKDPGRADFQIEYLPRYWFLDRGRPGRNGRRGYRFNVTAAPARCIARAQLRRVVDRLRDLAPDEAESVIAGAIRGIAGAVPEAGPHRLSMLLYPREVGRVRVRSMTGAMAPWLVSPRGIAAPVVLSGKTVVQLGTYVVSLEGCAT